MSSACGPAAWRIRTRPRWRWPSAVGLGTDASQVYGQIIAAPSGSFLSLIRLGPASYDRIRHKLAKVPGLRVIQRSERLFDSIAPVVTGTVGTETAQRAAPGRRALPARRHGRHLRPAGRVPAHADRQRQHPGRRAERGRAAGPPLRPAHRQPGHRGPTTIDSQVQLAADHALASVPGSAAIVAIQPGTGKVLAVAARKAGGLPAVSPLDGRYQPGQAFTIVSTAALLETGFDASSRIPCKDEDRVGGIQFSNHPVEASLGSQPLFAADFAHACGTAFAGLSMRLNARGLTKAAADFGIGQPWQLAVDSYPGTVGSPVGYGQLAATSVGSGGVRVSPLDMALAAGLVQSGGWYPPVLVTSPPDPGLAPLHPFDAQVMTSLRALMRATVARGAGTAANIGGGSVYGQVGNTSLGETGKAGKDLRAAWFVGYQGKIAFAVIELTKSSDTSAATLAGTFLHGVNG